MPETGDYTPKIWAGHNFASARAHYDSSAGRGYDDAVSSGKTLTDLLPKELTTNSGVPLVIVCDETGSMGEWPATIFSKLPYLYNEAHDEYLGADVEISFGAFGDAGKGETYPVQARPFAKKDDVKKSLEELIIEGGGGANLCESSELVALYYARQASFPRAVQKPIYIFITDEKCYTDVTKADAARVHVTLDKPRISAKEIFDELKEKYSVYLVLKPYNVGAGDSDQTNKDVRAHWRQYLDDDRIAPLADANRVVDVIFGILAREADKIDYFKKEIEGRQKPDQVDVVYKALKTVHILQAPDPAKKLLKSAGKSTMFRSATKGKKAKDLL